MPFRIPFLSRRVSGDKDSVPAVAPFETPDWVTRFRLWGVPLAAVAVLVLCAPGEQHIAELSGWHGWISWGLAGLFTLYAGLASVISTQLPKGSRGKASSIVGAVISLALAMAAQPISHLFVTGYLTAAPRPPLWLVATVSCVPPFILGHLLHFAAMPTGQMRRRTKDTPRRKDKAAPAAVPVAAPAAGTKSPAQAPALSPAGTGTPSPAAPTKVSLIKAPVPASVPVDELAKLRKLTDVVRALRAAGHGRDEIKAIVPTVPGYEDVKDNTLNTAIRRTA